MDINTGELIMLGEGEGPLKSFISILQKQMTEKQKKEMQVSKFDNKSELGKLFTGNRKARRKLAAIHRKNNKKLR